MGREVGIDGQPLTHGLAGVPATSVDMTTAFVVTDAPGTANKIVVFDGVISSVAINTIRLTEETTGVILTGPIYMAANSVFTFHLGHGLKTSSAGKRVCVSATSSASVMADLHYTIEV
jgi:hypothetical protein